MIRMGRNSKSETSDAPEFESSSPVAQTTASYTNAVESTNTVSKPSTDSENIARDIKDGKLSGFVGHGTSLTGDTSFQMMLRVDGHLTGTVKSDGGTLIVGNNGQLDANVSVGNAQINGTVNGDITATDRIQLGRTARVVGNIATPKLIIEDGALFEGGCTMLKARESADKQSKSAYSSSTPAASSSYSGSSSPSSTSSATSSPTISKSGDSSSTSATETKSETAKV